MSLVMIVVLASGAVVGLGVALLARALAPAPGPHLGDALDRLDERISTPTRGAPSHPTQPDQPLLTRLASPLLARLARLHLATPDEDLALAGWNRPGYLAWRLVLAPLAGLALLPLLGGVLALAGVGLPVLLTGAASLGLAGLGAVVVGAHVREQAAAARLEMRHALVSFLNVTALYRAAGSGIVEALDSAAGVADSWAYRRIALALDHAARAGRQPWEGLGELAESLGITELADLGSISSVSGQQGAGVFDTLLARARSLRTQLLTDERAEANTTSSTRMTYPLIGLALITTLFLLYPLVIRLLA